MGKNVELGRQFDESKCVSGGSQDLLRHSELPGSYVISDILPHGLDDPNPLIRPDIGITMAWADHPSVSGHIYQLESTPRRPDLSREDNFLLYYNGAINDQGQETDPGDSTFFKAVNRPGDMLVNCRVLWKGVEFVKRPRTAYWERLIVSPEFQGKQIGTAMGIYVLDFIFYRSGAYSGLPATEVRGSTYVDKLASGAGEGRIGFDRNELFLRSFGFEKDGNTLDMEDSRTIQPWKLTILRYEAARPRTIEGLGKDQPERKEYSEGIWPSLREGLRAKDPVYARNFTP
ncbi:MAG: hypothetical protein WD992_01580 [Candidatus Levyibacteriota bacterium]